MKAKGYQIDDLPKNSKELMEKVINNPEAMDGSPELNIAHKMTVKEYEEFTPYSKRLEENWGKPPGNLNSDGQNLLIYGKHFGNVFIGVQPTFGYEGDPMRLLYSRSASPHHGFAAYYTYVEKIWGADAVLHFGTHGSLEFMPGKQMGMSETCYPDSLIGSLPNLYYYAANNPSEATIAKRRGYASTISYLTPPAENAGLYKGLKELSELVGSYQQLRESSRGIQIVNAIVETSKQCNLDKDVDLPIGEVEELTIEDRDLFVGNIYKQLMEIESRLLPCGLHTIGEAPTAEEAVATLVNIASLEREQEGLRSLPGLLAESINLKIDEVYDGNNKGELKFVELNEKIIKMYEEQGCDVWFEKTKAELLGDEYNPDEYEKVDDILDVWFDSGCTHAFVLDGKEDQIWPASIYLEGTDQHRGWFHSSLLESCGTRGIAPYEAVLTHGFVLHEDGNKMSKSSSNIVPPAEIIEKSGADILRLWVVRVRILCVRGRSEVERGPREVERGPLIVDRGPTGRRRVAI